MSAGAAGPSLHKELQAELTIKFGGFQKCKAYLRERGQMGNHNCGHGVNLKI